MPDYMAGPHNESPNLLFYDGHVELRLQFYKGIAKLDPEYAQAGGFISWFLPTEVFD
jgi:prepilin-type processing-associated H-X9-DG protein